MEHQRQQREGAQQEVGNGNVHARQIDPKLQLTEDELQWAHQIKTAITADSRLRRLSDYEYAQWAIVTLARQDINEVRERIYKMQCFLEEYKILQSPNNESFVEEGLHAIAEGFLNYMPGYLLSVDYMPNKGHYILVLNLSAFQPAKLKTEHNFRTLLGGFYFLLQILNSNLSATREGIATIVECMDMGFQHFTSDSLERISSNLLEFYPMNQRENMWLNTPTAATIMLSCIKPFLPDEVKQRIRLGCKLDGYEGKIDKLFLTPTLEVAQESLLRRMRMYLTERIHNQSTFKLPDLPS